MRKIYLTVLLFTVALAFSVVEIRSQTTASRQKVGEIAQLFNKSKNKVKEKRGIRIEVSVKVENEPIFKQNVSEYSGLYKSDTGDWLELKIYDNGKIEAAGSEPSGGQNPRRFALRGARIENALLTGTKVYENGVTEEFTAAFIKRTVWTNLTDELVTVYGLGVEYDSPKKLSSDSDFEIKRLFYQLQRSNF